MKSFCSWFSVLAIACQSPMAAGLLGSESQAALRRPVALAESADGRWLYVANRDLGSVSVVDLLSRKVAAEHQVGQSLADLKRLSSSSRLLAVDESGHELIVLEACCAD